VETSRPRKVSESAAKEAVPLFGDREKTAVNRERAK
jgi:hypothetical protein